MNVYNQSVGKLLQHRIGQIIKELGYNKTNGYKVWINPKQGNDVDLKLWKKDSLILVGEIQNWSIKSELSDKRFRSMTKNLSKYECQKIVVHTALPKDKVKKFEKKGIKTLEIEYQILPKIFYEYFKQKGQITKRRIDNKITKKEIKTKISHYFKNVLKI